MILEYKQELLARGDHFLAKMYKTEFENMTRKPKKKWFENLRKLQRRYAIEKNQNMKGQKVITSYLREGNGLG